MLIFNEGSKKYFTFEYSFQVFKGYVACNCFTFIDQILNYQKWFNEKGISHFKRCWWSESKALQQCQYSLVPRLTTWCFARLASCVLSLHLHVAGYDRSKKSASIEVESDPNYYAILWCRMIQIISTQRQIAIIFDHLTIIVLT